MKDYNPVQLINHARYALTSARNDLKTAMLKLPQGRATYMDCMDCDAVLEQVQRQLNHAVQRQRVDAAKDRKLRQAEEFALKASVAKAREAVVAVVKDGVLTHSHK